MEFLQALQLESRPSIFPSGKICFFLLDQTVSAPSIHRSPQFPLHLASIQQRLCILSGGLKHLIWRAKTRTRRRSSQLQMGEVHKFDHVSQEQLDSSVQKYQMLVRMRLACIVDEGLLSSPNKRPLDQPGAGVVWKEERGIASMQACQSTTWRLSEDYLAGLIQLVSIHGS